VIQPEFLTLQIVLRIHQKQVAAFGGADGLRDLSLLESALSQPEQSFEGNFLHPTLFSMAAAYLFHICQNHPFEDGNKRTALASAMVFLALNGKSLYALDYRLETLTMDVASSRMRKDDVAFALEAIYKTRSTVSKK
jgi:death-on-curing protein